MASADDLTGLVSRLSDAAVTCIGDLMLDRFVYGEVARISPEAPIPVLRVTHENEVLGGAGNVIRNLGALGAKCRLYARIGEDPAGMRVVQLLQELPRCELLITRSPQVATTTKCRFVAGPQQMLRVDHESVPSAALSGQASIDSAKIGKLDAIVVLSDYGKGVLDAATVRIFLDRAKAEGKRVIVDPKGADFSRYAGADCITPNRAELRQATNMPASTLADVEQAARELIHRHGFASVLATLSEQGMLLVPHDGPAEHFRAEAREVYDVSGAGDTVVAVLAASLSVGASLSSAVRLANVAAGIVVGKAGTATVRPEELLRTLRFHQPGLEDKVVTREEAAETVLRWRREGKRVGFTNGCFDLLHPGHVTLLSKAAAQVDYLIVGINSDASVKRLKGPLRPVQSETARAVVLASIASVALVLIFGEDTPRELISLLRPDVLIKGADYTISTVVGADIVQGYGGSVVLVDIVPQQSTSRLVRRMSGVTEGTVEGAVEGAALVE